MIGLLLILIIAVGIFYLQRTGQLNNILSGLKLPVPGLPQQAQPSPQAPSEAQPAPPRGGTKTTPLPSPSGGAVSGGKIYPTIGKECTNVTGGELEDHDGPRIEPQITCAANFQDAEVTGYFLVPDGSDTISLKMRGPKHSGIPDAQMCNNIHYFPFGGNATKPFGKQFQHTAEYCDFGSPLFALPNFVGKWIGVKAIEWNNGSTVHMESWIDFPEGSGWKKWAQFDDVGSSSGCQKAPVYLKSPCSVGPVSIGFRIDGSAGTKFKNLSAREIAPGKATAAYTHILSRL